MTVQAAHGRFLMYAAMERWMAVAHSGEARKFFLARARFWIARAREARGAATAWRA